MLNANQVKVEVDYFFEWDEYMIRKVTDSDGKQYGVDPYKFLKLEEQEDEDDIHKSPEFLEYMKEMYGFSENTEFLVVSYEDEDEDDGGPCTNYIVEIYTIKDSYNFKILKVFQPGSEPAQSKEIPVDTDRIFCHLNNNRRRFPAEFFDYISEISGSKIDMLKIFFNYNVEGSEPAPDGDMIMLMKPAFRPSV